MQKIKLNDYEDNMGIFIDLENGDNKGFKYKNEINISYESLLINYKDILKKECKYYIFCLGGIRSRKAVGILEYYGYDVTWVYK